MDEDNEYMFLKKKLKRKTNREYPSTVYGYSKSRISIKQMQQYREEMKFGFERRKSVVNEEQRELD